MDRRHRRADTTESAAESQDRTNRTKNHKRPPSGGFDSREKRSLFIKAESDETPQCSVCGNQTPPNPLPVGSFWKPSPTEPSLRDAAVVCGKRAVFVLSAQPNPADIPSPVGSFSKTNPPNFFVTFLCKVLMSCTLHPKSEQKSVGSFGRMACFFRPPSCAQQRVRRSLGEGGLNVARLPLDIDLPSIQSTHPTIRCPVELSLNDSKAQCYPRDAARSLWRTNG